MRPDREWQDDAACKGLTRLFFSDTPADIEFARQTCAECPVFDECGVAAKTEVFGVWAATTPHERGFSRFRVTAQQRTKRIRHGSPAGYAAHLRSKEKACHECLVAHRVATAERAKARKERLRAEAGAPTVATVSRDDLRALLSMMGEAIGESA